LFVDIIENQIDFKRTGEGCRADVLVRPLGEKEDKWLPVQIKTTLKPYKYKNYTQYGFKQVGKYDRYLMCCICINEQKFWLMNGCRLYNMVGLTIMDE